MTTIDIAPQQNHRRLIQKKPMQITSIVTKGAIKSAAKLRLNLSQEQIQTNGEKIEILPPSELNQYQQTQEMIEAKESKNSLSQEEDDEDEDHSDENDDDYNSEESASEISQNISDLMASPAKEITSDQKDLAEEIEKEPDSIFGSAVAQEQEEEEEEKKENIEVPIEEIDSFFASLRQKKLKSTENSAMSVVQQILAKREAQKLKDEWKAINTRLQCLKTRNCILQTDNKTKAAE